MKEIPEATLDEFEGLALESVKHVRAFFAYQGADSKYFQKARLAVGAIGSYARIRASETNRVAVELAAQKMLASGDLR